MLGHDAKPTSFWPNNLVDGKPLERCPLRTILQANPKLVNEIERFRIEIYPFWKKGHLPRAGGVEDQSARELALLREFDRVGEVTRERYREIRGDTDGDDSVDANG